MALLAFPSCRSVSLCISNTVVSELHSFKW